MNNCESLQIGRAARRASGLPGVCAGPAIAKPSGYVTRSLPVIGVLLAVLARLFSASAQPYTVDWYKVSGGGGTSTGGVYSVSGTIGQHDAGGPMTGGAYAVTGGFWALYAVQTPGAPELTITYSGSNQAIVSWPLSVTGWTLQTNKDLKAGTWGNYLGPIISNSATVPSKVGNLFFRLTQ